MSSPVDVRPVRDYAAGHIPGSVSNHLRPQFATWLGWLLPPDVPIVIVRNPDQDPADILWPALNIGYANLIGELAGGIAGWVWAGGQLRSTAVTSPADVDTRIVIDVRHVRSDRARGGGPDGRAPAGS